MQESAHQLFVHESLELLQQIKDGLHQLPHTRNYSQTYSLMRAAHIIKDGAAQVSLQELSAITNRLEQILSHLWQEQIKIDAELAEQLLKVCDCLQLLLAQSQAHHSSPSVALAKVEPVFQKLEGRFGASLDNRVKSDGVEGIVQVTEKIEQILLHPEAVEFLEQLMKQVEILLGIGKILEMSQVVGIAETMLAGLQFSPHNAEAIGQIALQELKSHSINHGATLDQFEAILETDFWEQPLDPSFSELTLDDMGIVETTPYRPAVNSELTFKTANTLVWVLGSAVFTIPYRYIREHLVAAEEQRFQLRHQSYLDWRGQMLPLYQLSEILSQNLLLPGIGLGKTLNKIGPAYRRPPLLLVIQLESQTIALESDIDRLVSKSELTIHPFSSALAPSNYCSGFTMLDNDHLVSMIDVIELLNETILQDRPAIAAPLTAASTDIEVENFVPAFHPEVTSPNQLTPSLSSLETPTILVVDHSLGLQSELANSLLDEGYLITSASDFQEAIARLRHNSKIRLVICEFEAPNQNDLMFLSYRLHDPMLSKIPVVLMGACSTSQLQQLAMHLGATAYFSKPFDVSEFLAKLKQLTQLSAKNELN